MPTAVAKSRLYPGSDHGQTRFSPRGAFRQALSLAGGSNSTANNDNAVPYKTRWASRAKAFSKNIRDHRFPLVDKTTERTVRPLLLAKNHRSALWSSVAAIKESF